MPVMLSRLRTPNAFLPRATAATMIATALAASGCAGVSASMPAGRGNAPGGTSTLRHCQRGVTGPESPYRQPLEGPLRDPGLLAWLDEVPREVRRTMLAAGVERQVAELLRLTAAQNGELSLELLRLRQALLQQVSGIETQLNAAVFEADCTGDEYEHLLARLDDRARDSELRWTLASIVLGAVSGIAAGAWELSDSASRGPAVVGIAGGAASAGLGAFALFPSRRDLLVEHPRNLLAPLRDGYDAKHLYPSFVWRMLTLERTDGEPSPRARILSRWEEMTVGLSSADKDILFGEGGVYPHGLLDIRERLFDVLESELEAIFADLEILKRYLAQIMAS